MSVMQMHTLTISVMHFQESVQQALQTGYTHSELTDADVIT